MSADDAPSPPPRGPVDAVRAAVARLRATFRTVEPDERDAPRFRAHQLQAMLRSSPLAMPLNVVNALVLGVALQGTGADAFLAGWVAAVVAAAALGMVGWARFRAGPRRPTASVRALRRATVRTVGLAAIWAVLPAVMLPRVDAGAQFLIGTTMTGMMGAGALMLASVPAAATGWVAALTAGLFVALARWDAAAAPGAALMLSLYSATVVSSVWTHARTFGARLLAEARAERQGEVIGLLLRDFEEHASDLLWETDARGRFVHVAVRLAEVLESGPEATRTVPARTLLRRLLHPGEESHQHWAELRAAFARGRAFRDRPVCVALRDGARWWSVSARPLVDERGRLQGWRGVAADVTDRQLAHRRLRWLAHNDALTGLVNRTQFRELLQSWLRGPDGEVAPLAVLTFDMDAFKQVNDTRGHAAGDLLLRTFGSRLLAVARRTDTVARLGGDEFAMVLRGVGERAAAEPVLERLMAALAEPARIDDGPVSLRASVGVAFAPADGTDVDTLMNHADVAMYAAKHQGGQRWCWFDGSLADVARRRAALAQDLRGAVDRGELRLEFQPQVDTVDFRVRAFEALLRWRHPEHGDVPPSEFVGVAETAGLMAQIGDWVVAEACRQAARWPQPVRVAINVSASQLVAPGFTERVAAAAHGLRAGRVELELTESALAGDAPTVRTALDALRARGIRIALDDFGTGHSALGYLRRFPIDTLKIDRGFVTDLARDSEAQVVVDTILAMARVLGMTTVAEGVESVADARLLRDRGCTLLQGFLVSRPLTADGIASFLDEWRPLAGLLADADADAA